MRVRAIARGYYGGRIREVGDIFEATGKAAWFVPEGDTDVPKLSETPSTGRKPRIPKGGEPVSP